MHLAPLSSEASHLRPVVQTAEASLSFLMEDLRAHRAALVQEPAPSADMENWMNALQRQATPLVASSAGRANLKEWLALVEQDLGAGE